MEALNFELYLANGKGQMKKIAVVFLAVIISCIVMGCRKHFQWISPAGVSENQTYTDRAECMAMSRSGGGGHRTIQPVDNSSFSQSFASSYNNAAAAADNADQKTIFDNCMMGRGYRKVKEE